MTSFVDFRKGVQEVLETGHTWTGDQKVQIETRSAADTVVKCNVQRNDTECPLKASVKVENKVLGSHSVETGIDSDGKVSGLLKLKELYAGLVASLGATTTLSAPKANNSVQAEIDYKHELGTFNSSLVYPLNKEDKEDFVTLFTTASVFHKETGLNLGGRVTTDLVAKKVTDASAGFLHKAGNLALGGYVRDLGKVNAVHFCYDSAAYPVTIASEFGHNLPYTEVNEETKEEVQRPAKNWFTIGALYRPTADTAIRAKISHDGPIGLAYSQTIRQGVTLSLSAQLDAVALKSNKVGFGLKFDA